MCLFMNSIKFDHIIENEENMRGEGLERPTVSNFQIRFKIKFVSGSCQCKKFSKVETN